MSMPQMLRRTAIGVISVLTGLTLPAISAHAQETLTSVFAEAEEGAFLTYFVEECGGECPVAQFACMDPHNVGLGLMLPDFDDADVARFLVEGLGKATLAVSSATIEFVPRRFDFSEMSGAWDVSLGSWDSDASALEPLARSEPATIATIIGEIALPTREGDSANAREFIDACLARR
jgi:hypothetical protein